jgi:hypothetical protein
MRMNDHAQTLINRVTFWQDMYISVMLRRWGRDDEAEEREKQYLEDVIDCIKKAKGEYSCHKTR